MMKSKNVVWGLLAVVIMALAGCNGLNNDFNKKVEENETAIQKYISDNSLDMIKDSDGVYYTKTVSNPGGRVPVTGEIASLVYKTYTLDGKLIDSTTISKGPTIMPAGTGMYNILGLEIALLNMRIGEKATYLLSFFNAYGPGGFKTAPGYAPVRLEVELLNLRSEIQYVSEFVASKNYVVSEQTPDGWFLIRSNTVTGDSLGTGKVATVNYRGTFLSGTEFDKGTLTNYVTGGYNSIAGFDRAVRKMRSGEKAIAIFPSALGYGNQPKYDQNNQLVIRTYSSLLFELEILRVN